MKTINTNVKWAGLSAGILMAACLLMSTTQSALADDSAGQLTAKDHKFACAATEGGRTEVSLGTLAVQKGSSTAVRDFGQRMVDDHQKANAELGKLLAMKGATVPPKDSKKEDKLTTRLEGLSGTAFDMAYIKAMVADHKNVVKEFTKASEKSDDPDLKSWAAKTLPVIQEHLRMAMDIENAGYTTAAAK